MRKLKYLLVATIMSTTLLFGCGSNEEKSNLKELSAQELVENVSKGEIKDTKSFEFTIDTAIDVSMGTAELPMNIKGDLDVNGQIDIENKLLKLNASVDAMGQKLDVECFVSAAGETPTLYYKMNDTWTKQTLEMDDIAGMFDPIESGETSTEDAKVEFEKILEYLSGAKVETKDDTYVLSGTIDFAKIMEDMEKETVEESDEDAGAAVSGVLETLKDLKLNVKVVVNSDYTFNAFEFSVDKFSTEVMGSTMSINTLSIEISVDKYNKIDTIKIPEDALNAPESDFSGILGIM